METTLRQSGDNLILENAEIIFRNFSGKASKFNKEGDRNFCVFLPEESFESLKSDGWNPRMLASMYEDEEARPYLQVAIAYKYYPPKIYLVTGNNKTLLDEDMIGQLDYDDIESVDIVIRPYNWEVSGRHGKKAYVKNMYVKIYEDELASKYAMPDVPF